MVRPRTVPEFFRAVTGGRAMWRDPGNGGVPVVASRRIIM